MPRARHDIRCETKLLRPKHPGRGGSWHFLVLPKAASAKLPTRGQTFVEGTLNGQPFQAMLEPDGQKSHWLKVGRALRERARAEPNATVALTLSTGVEPPEPKLPTDLREALAAHPEAASTWSDITCAARWDWLQWITSARREETRARRIAGACDMLASGKRRVCCFDRSGFYSKELNAPEAAE